MTRVIPAMAFLLLLTAWIVASVLGPNAAPGQKKSLEPERRVLRVCADPNDLPQSNEKREGFENRIAEVIAKDLNADLQYLWWAQRRGFIRNTLRAGECDLLLNVPTALDMVLVTAPYYRSTYVFVYRRGADFKVDSFDSDALRRLRIGVQIVGDDYTNTPPAHALARRGIVRNVRGFRVAGDYKEPNPPARIIEAVAAGEIDIAIAWGPLAGYFATRQSVPLEVKPVSPQIDLPFLPFVFDMSMAVRRGEEGLKTEIEQAIERRRAEIDRILNDFAVPRVESAGA